MTKTRLTIDHYPIIIRQSGSWMRALNFDFGIEIGEQLAKDPRGRLLQKMSLLEKIHLRIAEHLEILDQLEKPYPIPISTENILNARMMNSISLKEASKLLGEAPHTVRRMADDGELSVTRTRKGHRRFSRSEIEAIILKRDNKDAIP